MSRPILNAFLAATIASGCATGPQMTYHHAAASPALPCASQAACDAAWANLQVWISQHSTWRIRMANETLIETFGPSKTGYSGGELAFSATRLRNADGSGSISIRTACAWGEPTIPCDADPRGAIDLASAAATGN